MYEWHKNMNIYVDSPEAKEYIESLIEDSISFVKGSGRCDEDEIFEISHSAYGEMLKHIEEIAIMNEDKSGRKYMEHRVNSFFYTPACQFTPEMLLGYNYAFVKEAFPDGAVLNENADGIDYAAAGAYSAYVRCGGEIMGIVDNDLIDKGERAILKVWRSR